MILITVSQLGKLGKIENSKYTLKICKDNSKNIERSNYVTLFSSSIV